MTAQSEGRARPPDRTGGGHLIAVLLLTLLVPFAIRLVPGAAATERLSYMPVFSGRRQFAFQDVRIEQLKELDPGVVIIGDSMAGTRINERLLWRLSGLQVAPLLQAGSGSAFWYLALKNWVVASGIRPRLVFIFFRDTNLTDVMFRLDNQYRWSVEIAAGSREDELNAVVESALNGKFHRAHTVAELAYHAEEGHQSIEPIVAHAPAAWVAGRAGGADLLTSVNERLGLAHLRVMEAADMSADEGTDFAAAVDRSVLPLMLREARRGGFKLCFVRVRRRPVGGAAPVQSRALLQYARDLRQYVQSHGAILHDETNDSEITLDMYEDGDHIARHARDRYTRLFYERLRVLFRTPPAAAASNHPPQ